MKALAEAEAIKAKKVAEAEGELKLAEVLARRTAAETENIANLKRSGLGDAAIVQWSMKEEYKNIAGAQASMLEHLNLGNVTVLGGSGEVGSFILDLVSKVQKISAVRDMIPGMSGVIEKLEKFDNNQQIESKSDDDTDKKK